MLGLSVVGSASSLTRARSRSRAKRSASNGIQVLVVARPTSVSSESFMNRSMVSVLRVPENWRWRRSAACRI